MGGATVDDAVRRLMLTVLSYDLGSELNWVGRGQKRSFRNTRLQGVLFRKHSWKLYFSTCVAFFYKTMRTKTKYLQLWSTLALSNKQVRSRGFYCLVLWVNNLSLMSKRTLFGFTLFSAGALKRTPVGKEATHHQFADVVKKWLRFAPFRQRGSGRRQHLKPVEFMCPKYHSTLEDCNLESVEVPDSI